MKKGRRIFVALMVIMAFSLCLFVYASTASHDLSIAQRAGASELSAAETGQRMMASSAQSSVTQSPVAVFTFTPEIPQPDETIVFDASASYALSGSIVQYSWDFGDGTTTTVTSPTITYSYPLDGSYTVELTVTDSNGQTGTAAAVVQVQKDVNFRVCFYGTVVPIPNAQVTVYYNNGAGWVKVPATKNNPGVTVEYDNVTQPNEAQQYRNPAYTASILLNNATNIEFDIHPSSMEVYFKFQWGTFTAYWPDSNSTYYRYNQYSGSAVAHNFEPGKKPRWDPGASAYVIQAADILSGESREGSPIMASIFCPPPAQQWYLNVKTDPTGITTIPGQGWYVNGSSVTLTAPTYVNVSTSTRYRFNYWDVDGTSRGSGVNPITIIMAANHTATAHYVMQYSATFSQAGLSSDATGTVVTVNGNPETYTQLPFTLWADSGSVVTYSYSSIVSSSVSGKQFSLIGVTGPSSPITIGGPVTITGNYVVQYQVTLAQTGLDSSATGTVVTVNGSAKVYSSLPYALWVSSGSSITYSYTSIISSSVSGKQFKLSTVSGPSSPIIVTGPVTVTGNYVIQYLVTFTQTGLDSTASGTIVNVNGSAKIYSALPYTSWLYSGSSITYSYSSTVASSVSGKQFSLTGVTGPSSPITVTASSTITGNYKTQYYLTVTSARDSPSPLSGWFDSGSGITESVTSPVSGGSGIQYVCTGWSGSGSVPASGSGSSVTFTIIAPSAITWNWKTQYYLTVTSPYDSPTPVSGWFDSGSSVTESVTSPASGPVGIQYVCTGWSGTGSVPASGSGSSVTFTIGAASSIVWNWKIQYYLTVTSARDSPSPLSGWFDSGSGITESVTSPVSGGSGTQYVCTGWTGTGSVPASGSNLSVTFTIAAPSSIVWNWKTQYYLTVTSARDSPSPLSGWFDSGSGITESVTSPVSGGSGIQYVCTGWSGSGSVPASGSGSSVTFTIIAPSAITWNWKTQYTVTFDHSGLDSSASGTVVTVNGNPITYGQLAYTIWVDSGTSVAYSYNNVSSSTPGKQFILIGVTGLPSAITVMSPTSVTGNYVTQYQVTFSQTGVGSDFAGTVATVDSNTYTVSSLPVSFWWDSSSSHTFSFSSPLTVNASEQYTWVSTSGLTALQSGSLSVTGSGSVTGNYANETKFQVTFSQTGVSADFTGTVVNIDGTNYKVGDLSTSFWWDSGSVHNFVYQSPLLVGVNMKQYVWANTTGLSTLQSDSVTVTTSGAITGNYKTQYYLAMATDPSGVTSPSGTGWYDAGTGVTVSTNAFVSITPGISRYRFNGWTTTDMSEITNPLATPTTVLIDKAKTVTATYAVQYNVTFNQAGVGLDFTGTVAVIDGGNFAVINLPVSSWYDNNTVHTFSFQSPLVAVPNAKGYSWTSTTGLSTLQTGTLTILASGSVTGNYKTQYYLTVTSGHDSPNPGSGWFDSGASITALVTSPASGPTGTQYLCTGWSGTGSVPSSGSGTATAFIISQASTITWNWKTQYYLATMTDPLGLATIPGQGWYDASSIVPLNAPPVTNWNFSNWVVDGYPQGSTNPTTLLMDMAHTVTAHYTQAPGQPITLSISPMIVTVTVGTGVPFTSTISGGTPPYAYQWYLDGDPVPGANSSTWTFSASASGVHYVYLQVIDAINTTAVSGTARVEVLAIPVGGYSVSMQKPTPLSYLGTYMGLVGLFGAVLCLKKRKRK